MRPAESCQATRDGLTMFCVARNPVDRDAAVSVRRLLEFRDPAVAGLILSADQPQVRRDGFRRAARRLPQGAGRRRRQSGRGHAHRTPGNSASRCSNSRCRAGTGRSRASTATSHDIKTSRSLFAERLPRLAGSRRPARHRRRPQGLCDRPGRAAAAHRRAHDRCRQQRAISRPGGGLAGGGRGRHQRLQYRARPDLLAAGPGAGRLDGAAGALRPAAAAPPRGRRGGDPARRGRAHRGPLPARDRAARHRTEPADGLEPRDRRARPAPMSATSPMR